MARTSRSERGYIGSNPVAPAKYHDGQVCPICEEGVLKKDLEDEDYFTCTECGDTIWNQ